MTAQQAALYNLDRPDELKDLNLDPESKDYAKALEVVNHLKDIIRGVNWFTPEQTEIAYQAVPRIFSEPRKTRTSARAIAAAITYFISNETPYPEMRRPAGFWVADKAGITETAIRKNPYAKTIKAEVIELMGQKEEFRESKLKHYKRRLSASLSKAIEKGAITDEELADELENFSEFCRLDSAQQYFLAFSMKDERPDTSKQKACGPNTTRGR